MKYWLVKSEPDVGLLTNKLIADLVELLGTV